LVKITKSFYIKHTRFEQQYRNFLGLPYVNSRGTFYPARVQNIADCSCNCRKIFQRDEIRAVFENFNRLANHTAQNVYLQGCVENAGAENLSNGATRRVFRYKISLSRASIYVCQKFFCGLHGVTRSRLRKKGTTYCD